MLALAAALCALGLLLGGSTARGSSLDSTDPREQPSIQVTVDPTSATPGQEVTITALVTGPVDYPAGTVKFATVADDTPIVDDGNNSEFSVQPVEGSSLQGEATLDTRSFQTGTYDIVAYWTPADAFTFQPADSKGSPVELDVYDATPARTSTKTTLGIDPATVVQGQHVALTATVTADGGSNPTGDVIFYDGSQQLGDEVTLVDGVATNPDVGSFGAGAHNLYASYQGNSLYKPSQSKTTSFTLEDTSPKPTKTFVDLSVSTPVIHQGDPVDLTAHVTQTGGTIVPHGGEVTFYSNVDCNSGTLHSADQQSSAPVDDHGDAKLIGVGSWAVQDYTLCASYVGDSFGPSSGTASLRVLSKDVPIPGATATTLTYTGPAGGDFDDPMLVKANLIDSLSGAAVESAPVTFTLGSQSCTGTTNGSGDATCPLTPAVAAGSATLHVSYPGDGSMFLGSSADSMLTITREETTLALTAPPAAQQGSTVTLTASLLEDGTTPVDGRTVTFTYGGTHTCTGTTSGGVATCQIPAASLGPLTVSASFAADSYYATASAPGQTVYVYAPTPGGGMFVIGDGSAAVGSNVTFWGSQWSKENSLSVGSAPSSFKGYALHATTTCGGTWSTDPGNSTPPPAGPLPSYIAVVVASSAAKSGAAISGHAVHVVVVKTASGYDGNPGHAGSGAVVATIC
jgi:hypothetical protein